MYDLPKYKEQDDAVIKAFIRQHPFALLTGVNGQQQPVATQIPVFIDERDGRLYLSGHIMKQTDHHRAFVQNPQALIIFTGPHTYVSASWYQNKKQGSTWNYMTVHAHGNMRFLDEKALRDVLHRTTRHFENDPHSGANYEDLPQEYVDQMAKAIVAFELEVTRLEHVFKLSQNRDQVSYDNIIARLQEQGGQAAAVAQEMQKRRSQLFKADSAAE